MIEDDILREIRKVREDFAAQHNYDISAMVETLRKLDEVGDWPVIKYRARTDTEVSTPEPISPFDLAPSATSSS